jgi:hypothetical protein
MPSITDRTGLSLELNLLPTATRPVFGSNMTRSINVPPISMPSWYLPIGVILWPPSIIYSGSAVWQKKWTRVSLKEKQMKKDVK